MRIIFIILCLAGQLSAQTFVAEGTLPPMEKDGFYRIALTPEAMIFIQSTFGNLRIVDNVGKETPYILEEDVPVFSTAQFKEYVIAEKKYQKDCCTKLILSNPGRSSISNISLQIKNAETSKEATLLGSDDRETWYALKEHFYLNTIDGGNRTFETRILDFPLSNYKFLSLTVNDSTTAPLNIIKVGYYDVNTVDGLYSAVPLLKFSVEDKIKEKQSHVTIKFDTARLMDKLEFTISGQPFYHRYATLYEIGTQLNQKGKAESFKNYLQTVELTSTHTTTLRFSGVKWRNLLLIVENNDNPPLQFDSVQASQLNRYATAWLKKGISYSIKMGDSSMSSPIYDLDFFRDSIPNQSPVIRPVNISAFATEKKITPTNLFNNKQIIWVAIILVAIVLGYMSVKMIKEKGT